MTTETKNLDTRALLKWILGSAALGASARGAYHLMSAANPKKPWKREDDLYEPAIEMPVRMTRQQIERYKQLRKQHQLKAASAWAPTAYTLGTVGGVAAGWKLTDMLIHRLRKRRLEKQLQAARDELAALSDPRAFKLQEQPEEVKVASVWLDQMAEHYQKTAGVGGKLLDMLRSVGGSLAGAGRRAGQAVAEKPYHAAAAGLGTAAVGASAVPVLRGAADAAGRGMVDLAKGGGKFVGTPLRDAAIYTLGPIAALSLLYGLTKGISQSRQASQRRADLKAFAKAVREQERRQTPYLSPVPVETDDEEREPRRARPAPRLTQSYSESQGDII